MPATVIDVCQNLEPSFKCETIPNACHESTPCWSSAAASACYDRISELKVAGVAGKDPLSSEAYICQCPEGYSGDGLMEGNGCEDIDECESYCKEGKCTNTEGGYTCECSNGGEYDPDTDSCGIGTSGSETGGLAAGWVILIVLAIITICAVTGYGLYKYRLKSYMDAEIRSIMAQYMPLDKETFDNEGESPAGNAL